MLRVLALACLVAAASAETVGVLGFGNNENGQLGLEKPQLELPEALKTFSAVCVQSADMSDSTSIFATCDGTVYVSGSQLTGAGAFSLDSEDKTDRPVVVTGLGRHNIVQVGAGESHFVALSDQGKVFTWGHNPHGQLGYGGEGSPLPFSASPMEVSTLARQNIRLVVAGGNRTAAVNDRGELYMWGDGSHGEMGDGNTRSHRKPTLVKAINNNGQRVCQVAIGGAHVAAVTNAGDLYTWGDGDAGQLGLGDFGLQKRKPNPVHRLRRNTCFVSAGKDFTSVITQDERMFLWGSHGYPAPFEKSFFQGLEPRQSAAGSAHMVVLLNNGSVVTWGSRRYGQAGRDFPGEFTLNPATIDTKGFPISQIQVGSDSTLLIASGIPAPSLCPCLKNHYTHWRNTVKFLPTCYGDESSCGDGSCCASGSTCCQKQPTYSNVADYRAVDERPSGKSAFACVASPNAVCCGHESGMACPKDNKCNLDASPRRCEPSWISNSMPEEDRIAHSVEPLKWKESTSPGFVAGSGVCGARKETCPDETCCNKGQTCCPMADGSYGCCEHANGVCCKAGCCKSGYKCDDSSNSCIKDHSTAVQGPVQSHCGLGKQQCPDTTCCGKGHGCCMLQDGFFGCCPYSNGVCCADGAGCCPSGHTCDVPNSQCVRIDDEEVKVPMKATPRNTPQRPAVSEVVCPDDTACQYPGTCCAIADGKFACCDFVNGTCCAGGVGCCPGQYTCDLKRSMCLAHERPEIPMKFARDSKPKQQAASQHQPTCPGKTQCDDNTCCPMGSTCCGSPDGSTTCCDTMEGQCCEDGGCCHAGDKCNTEKKMCVRGAKSYPYLGSQRSTSPPPSKAVREVSNPGKCYAEERLCDAGFCCPRSSTCCSKGFGQTGCCPFSHGVCCEGGGCCPGGTTCDAESKQCLADGKDPAPMLTPDNPHPPEAEWDIEECWDDEQTCPGDGGCCLKTETCCLAETDEGTISACCPFENGVCCAGGAGCCPSETHCDADTGACIDVHGNVAEESAAVKGSALHPLAGLAEIDCPDGSVCGPLDTCCSLGYDEEWGEEIYACCPYENAVCCAEFEGCCPSGYECEAETQQCVNEGREIESGANNPSDPPPTFVCQWPETQCPNGRCCAEDQQCAQIESGNYKCVDRGFVYCNKSMACPAGLFCDERHDGMFCSEVQDNDESVKRKLLHEFWGDDVEATCHSLLIQESASQSDFSPKVKVERPPKQFWYPKKLVAKSKAVTVDNTTLPTLLAAKVCQHLHIVEPDALREFCFLSNSNGHFAMKDRDRVHTLVQEYIRRVVERQHGVAPQGEVYEFVAEELDPCPCRERPTPAASPEDDISAGDASGEAEIEEVAEAEAIAELIKPEEREAPMFLPPVEEVPDEKPASAVGMGASTGGAVPVASDAPVEVAEARSAKLTLVPTNRDSMQMSSQLETPPHRGDTEMLNAKKPEVFMGKEGCEDNTEQAVDLDADADNAQADAAQEVSLAQMNAAVNADAALMPETE